MSLTCHDCLHSIHHSLWLEIPFSLRRLNQPSYNDIFNDIFLKWQWRGRYNQGSFGVIYVFIYLFISNTFSMVLSQPFLKPTKQSPPRERVMGNDSFMGMAITKKGKSRPFVSNQPPSAMIECWYRSTILPWISFLPTRYEIVPTETRRS